jgi:preprotein translocase subunit SecD
MTGQSVVSVEETASADPLVPDGTEFILTLDAAGAGSFARITSDRVGHRIAFVVDGIVLDAPTIEDPVPDGVIIIITPTPALTSLLQGAVKPR